MDEKQSKKFALALLKAVSVEDVESVIKLDDKKSPFRNPDNWVSYGNTDANWAVVRGQSVKPVPALTELIINSIDAVLMRKAQEQGINQRGKNAPASAKAAVNRFFPEVPDGDMVLLGQYARTNLAERSVLLGVKRGTDSRKYPAYTLADFGEGQNADNFPKTLLSLGEKNKEGIPFVQGRGGMQSTASICFCTRSNVNTNTGSGMYKLIMSKRTLADSDGKWGWTLIRVCLPKPDEGNFVVQYFSPAGKIAKFQDKSIRAFGRKDIGVIDGGTIVKLYEYDIGANARSVDLGLYGALPASLLKRAIPIRIYDFDATKIPERGGLRKYGIAARTFPGTKVIDAERARRQQDKKILEK